MKRDFIEETAQFLSENIIGADSVT